MSLSWSPGRAAGPYVSVDYRLAAPQNRIVPPEKATAGYGVMAVKAGLTAALGENPLHINLQIQNLLNTNYMDHTSFYRLIELPEMGRNVVLSLRIPIVRMQNEND